MKVWRNDTEMQKILYGERAPDILGVGVDSAVNSVKSALGYQTSSPKEITDYREMQNFFQQPRSVEEINKQYGKDKATELFKYFSGFGT